MKFSIKWMIYILVFALLLFFPITVYKIYMAPIELRMGLVQKIFYFHMPSAIFSMVFFFFAFLFSIAFLIKKKHTCDHLASTSVEIGVLLSTFVLISGPLWAKKAWGAYWVWDARLTFSLIMWLIYASYLVIRSSELNDKLRKISASLAIMGFIDIPLVHFSTQKWGGMHPVVTQDKGVEASMAPEMATALYLSLITMFLIGGVLFFIRFQSKTLMAKLKDIEFQLMENLK